MTYVYRGAFIIEKLVLAEIQYLSKIPALLSGFPTRDRIFLPFTLLLISTIHVRFLSA